jgi:putative transposase
VADCVIAKHNKVKYAWIKRSSHAFSVTDMCRVLGVIRSGYYNGLKALPSERAAENERITEKLRIIFADTRSTYGTRSLKRELKKIGFTVSRRRIGRLMQEAGLICKTKRQCKVTTDSKHKHLISPNLLNRPFNVPVPHVGYVGDITYIWTQEGWLYLAVVIGLYSRRVVGYSMNKRMKAGVVSDAWLKALWSRKPEPGLLWHADRGSQYASKSRRPVLKQRGIKQSMSRTGNGWGNSVSKRFFPTLKTELIHHEKFATREQACHATFEYIEVFYNRKRRHSSNDYLSPCHYEAVKT